MPGYVITKSRTFQVNTTPLLKGAVPYLFALDCQEAVTRILVYFKTVRQVSSFWALILAEVVDSLLLAAAKNYVLRI
jgi:hypothetical protein